VPARDYRFSRSERRILRRNEHLQRHLVEAEATREQFELLGRYLDARHPGGGMSGMSWPDYVAMVEDTTARTHIVEWRQPSEDHGPGELAGCAIIDVLGDGLSLVYSFFDPALSGNSPGVFAILDHIVQAQLIETPYVYLGYWVRGSDKMDYKARFRPLEVLRYRGWTRLTDSERS
jgi:arginine-tRNA-protein transferase